MKRIFEEETHKKIIIAFWVTLVISLLVFVAIFVSFSRRLKSTADMGLLTINTTTKVANHFGGTWVRIEAGRFLEACSSSPGTDKSAGLPNIKGMLYNARGFMGERDSETSTNGALSKQWINGGSYNNLSWGGANRQSYLYFNASEGDCGTDTTSQTTPTYTGKDNSVYGKSTTVQPKSRTVYIYRRTA